MIFQPIWFSRDACFCAADIHASAKHSVRREDEIQLTDAMRGLKTERYPLDISYKGYVMTRGIGWISLRPT